jgi:hypothetical protein
MATTLPNTEAMSADEISRHMCAQAYGSLEQEFFEQAWYRALTRELDAKISALPDDAVVLLRDAAGFLCLTSSALLTWIYKGKLTGTRKSFGIRRFRWIVPVAEIRRIRIEQNARITRDRAWMYEPLPLEHTLKLVAPREAGAEHRALTAGEFMAMWGSDPSEEE